MGWVTRATDRSCPPSPSAVSSVSTLNAPTSKPPNCPDSLSPTTRLTGRGRHPDDIAREEGAPVVRNAFYKVDARTRPTRSSGLTPDFSDAPLGIVSSVSRVSWERFAECGSIALRLDQRFRNNGRPFSRAIRSGDRRPVSLVVGDKLSGQFGGFDVGRRSACSPMTRRRGRAAASIGGPRNPSHSRRIGKWDSSSRTAIDGADHNTVAGLTSQYRDFPNFSATRCCRQTPII